MTSSKVFLGITASLLAVAGFAASKAHRNPISTYYYTTQSPLTCHSASGTLNYTKTSGTPLTITGNHRVFLSKVGSTCSTPLFKGL